MAANKLTPTASGNLAGNCMGGLSAAFYTLPYSIAYGIVATSPLGVEAISLGVMLGLLSGLVSGLLGPCLGGDNVLIGTPRPASALLYASVLQGLILFPEFQGSTPIETFQRCLPVLSILTVLGGAAVLLLNRLGLSGLVSKIPMPVIKGYILASTLLSMYKQIPLLIGISSIYLLIQGYWVVVTGAFLAGAVYFALAKMIPKSPGAVFALFCGTGFIAIFSMTGDVDVAQFQLGEIQSPSVLLTSGSNWMNAAESGIFKLIILIAPVVMVLVFFISLETQITLAHLESSYSIDSSIEKELDAIGWANIACGLLGSIPCGYYISGSTASLSSGATDRKSEWFYALFVAMILATAPYFLSILPTPVIGAVVITASLKSMDQWIFKTVSECLIKKEISTRKPPFVSAAVSLSVVITAILFDFQAAVFMGLTLTTVLFLFKQSDYLIKAEYTLKQKRSTKMRNNTQNGLLDQNGDNAVIIVLRGNLFFGNFTELKKKTSVFNNKSSLLIDCSHLIDADITGVECLKAIVKIRNSKGLKTWVSGLNCPQHVEEIIASHPDMDDLERAARRSTNQEFISYDEGLELIEEELLDILIEKDDLSKINNSDDVCNAFNTDLMIGLSQLQAEIVVSASKVLNCYKGDTLFAFGDQGDGMYVLLSGRVSVLVPSGTRKLRVMSYSPGVLFGEMAVIDKQPRMAEAFVDEDSKLLHLSMQSIETLQKNQPEITQQLFLNIARVLSTRLRIAMRELKA